MEIEKGEIISIRVSEELYKRLKKYADEHGESISDVCRKAIEQFLTGSPLPSPPSDDILEIKRRLEELNKKIDETLIKGKWWIAGLIGLMTVLFFILLAVIGLSD